MNGIRHADEINHSAAPLQLRIAKQIKRVWKNKTNRHYREEIKLKSVSWTQAVGFAAN